LVSPRVKFLVNRIVFFGWFIADVIAMIVAALGYVALLALAAKVSPRLVNAVSGRLSLYGAMALTAALTIFITLVIAYIFLSFFGVWYLLSVLAIVAAMSIISWLFSPIIINAVYGARPSPELQEVVNRVAARLGVKPPKAVVVDGPPNAFAYGSPVAGRYVAVTTGMLRLVDMDELEAVIGHELGHHRHRDMVVMTALGLAPSFVYYLGYFAIHAGLSSLGERNGSGGLVLIGLGALAIAVSFLIQLLVLAFSRLREYYADVEGARAAGRDAMQRALAKLHLYYASMPGAREEVATSKIKALFIYAFTEAYADSFVVVDRRVPGAVLGRILLWPARPAR